MEFTPNLYARKQLEIGNECYRSNNMTDAEISWNNAIKSACTVTCYDNGVIFLASYKLAQLYSFQSREIERNVVIHQALTAYHRVFDEENGGYDEEQPSSSSSSPSSPQPPPFYDLIAQLQELRKSQPQEHHQHQHNYHQHYDNDLSSTPSFPNYSPSSTIIPQSLKIVYNKNEIEKLRISLDDIEMPIEMKSYQNIVHIPESPPIKRTTNKKSSQSQKKSTNQSSVPHPHPHSRQQQQQQPDRAAWSSSTGPSLDNILDAVVGEDYSIVKETRSVQRSVHDKGKEGDREEEGEGEGEDVL